jgi:DNA polymerase-3 subunit gamma/tau
MLGTVDRTRVGALLDALADGHGQALLAEVAALAELSPDWGGVLEALTDALHRVQVRQLVPEMPLEADGVDVDALAARVRPEVVQLWYQMALAGRRDLSLAPSARAGFEMSLLRMLAFRPADTDGGQPLPVAGAKPRPAPPREATRVAPVASAPPPPAPASSSRASPSSAVAPANLGRATQAPAAVELIEPTVAPALPLELPPEPASALPLADPDAPQAGAPAVARTSMHPLADAEAWHHLVATSPLRGPARLLAEHAGFVSYVDGVLSLSLPATDDHLRGAAMIRMVADALAPALGGAPQIRFEAATQPAQSLRERNEHARDQRQLAAEDAFMNDPDVQRLISQHGAKIVPDSIRPFDE